MRIAVFTNVEHKEREGNFYAYAPYIREMKLWLRHVEEVEVVAPVKTRGAGDEAMRRNGEQGTGYEHSELAFTEVPSFNFLDLSSTVRSVFKIPFIILKILKVMRRADHLHLRCPGNIGLLACICQIFFPSKSKSAKYAGNWDPAAKQPWTYRFQKWLLSNTFFTKNMQVLVYGEWPGQSKNVVPFFTASFSEREKTEVRKKTFSETFIFLFVGNLVEGKRPLEVIKLVEKLNFKLRGGTDQEIRASYVPIKLELYGDGLERKKLETYVRENHLEQLISFKGNCPLAVLKEAYQKAHFVILLSKSEGWPKALAEGMFFGCIPIATPVSCVPWMLDFGRRGVLFTDPLPDTFQKSRQFECPDEHRDVSRTGFSETPTSRRGRLEVTESEWSVNDQWERNDGKILSLLKNPEEMKRMSEEAKKWSQEYTLERFEGAIKKVLLHSNEEVSVSKGKLSPAPFRACPDSSGEGVKRGKSEE